MQVNSRKNVVIVAEVKLLQAICRYLLVDGQ
jgi:hypothetical protein